ncbi:response regulator [Kineosporia sp. J2-2]|uniref:Response regulator n=1 Tax=Kineosporia corallincola TaxID=2835133 RepID=A0ABS5TNJ4_9ACTN|nr:response regulator [Kineosporia corallincola]MBT0771628.1 response regulator [Kineosporia corallincola]
MTGELPIRTLIAEADPLLADTHVGYVGSTAGFTVSGLARTGAEVLGHLDHAAHDLILLDLDLPDVRGLDLCRTLRAGDRSVDVMAVTSATDLGQLRAAVSLGIVHCLLKPLHPRTFRGYLRWYAGFRQRTADASEPVTQRDVDSALALLRPETGPEVASPQPLSSPRMIDQVAAHLRLTRAPVSANEVAAALGISRVTARHYLEELASRRLAAQTRSHGSSGRPRHLYRWNGA